ncbi:MAG: carboxypeptidase regulatory-like domain-containing protein, partial [Candidatus Cloacimonetes bacterium]|nr:carboxypeptidase regulatory-like domain-containing protein [Candidatus Cloacimonadota bacterium]
KYNMVGECFAEKFHRYTYNGENSGALGIIAASEVSYSFVNDTYVWGMFDNMWSDFLPTYDSTPIERGILPAFGNAAGKYFLQQSNWPYNTNNKEVTYNLFHHHGDAFTNLFSEVPQNLTISHDPELLSEVSTFNVTADEGALIALSVEGEIIGLAEGTGSPTAVTIEPQIPPTQVDIVITKQNYYRYETTIMVSPPDGPYVVYDSHTIIDDWGNGNNNGVLDYGEEVMIDLTLANVGSELAEGVYVWLFSTDEYLTVTDSVSWFGDIPAGETHTMYGSFSFEVAGDVPNGHVIDFIIQADGVETWESYFSIQAFAPNVEYTGNLIDDSSTGNNNQFFDPEETVDLNVTINNSGDSDAYNVLGELTSSDPYITVNTIGTVNYGDVVTGGEATQSYSVTASPDTPYEHPAEFNLEITGDYGLIVSFSFIIEIGADIELFFDDFEEGIDNWTVINDGGIGLWTIYGEPYPNAYDLPPSSSGNVCAADSDETGSGTTTLTTLLLATPLNLSMFSEITLEFDSDFNAIDIDDLCFIEVSADGGDTWDIALQYSGVDVRNTHEELDISDVASGEIEVLIRFRSVQPGWDWWWVIDNVGVYGGGAPLAFGTVSGFVLDAETNAPIEGADIAGFTTSSADGSYTMDMVVGTYDLTCSAENYFDLTIDNIVVEEGVVTDQDFLLTPSFPPNNVQASAVDYNDVTITWEAPATEITVAPTRTPESKKRNDTAIISKSETNYRTTRSLLGYKIYKDDSELVEIDSPSTLTYTDEALDAGEYVYTVTALYDEGESAQSAPVNVTITLPAPINVSAQSQDPNIILSWDIPAARGLASYTIYRNTELLVEEVTDSPYEDMNVASGNYIYNVVAVFDGGWESEMSDNAFVSHTGTNNMSLPEVTALTGNYPNPFNPETTVSFSLSEAGYVSLNIYNMRGQLVKTLVNEQLEAAYHDVVWDGRDNNGKNVSSGIYFYKMQSGKYSRTSKMILMK